MKWYAILFKYAEHWHMDIFPCEEDNIQNIRLYLIEATRHSIERNKLKTDDCNTVAESQLREIRCEERSEGSGAIVIDNEPIYAVKQIELR